MQDAACNRIQDCVFEHLGGWALVGVGATDHNEFVGNTVQYVGQGGVFLDGQDSKGKLLIGDDPETGGFKLAGERPPDSGPTGNVISGNHIHHIGLVYAHVAGFYGDTTHENVISHNFVHDVPRYGISLKRLCRGNRVEFNEVRRTNLETNDTGAIETYTTTTPNTIVNNLVVDSVGLKVTEDKVWHTPFYSWGIYLDGYSSNQTVTNNICLRNVLGGLMMNGGWDNQVENNIFANGSERLITLNNYLKKYKGSRFLRNIIYSDLDPPADVQATNWTPDLDFQIASNVYWIRTGAPPSISAAPWEKWREWGFDKDSVVADPLFEDISKEDFRLKADSPAIKLGFKPIDVSRIGLKGYVPLK
jgi:parallel beta-helix repeat protein